ncbi:hypothetical protein [Burkholderia sp. L27(2015)]|uniref:DUF2515 family protein n=1 Tax=Burkholderia sp. L27(2015) TaxID=1641858 RepID=UPI00131E0B64|nr:hypothetical protein [Burkholderia sp. L27(2015)]
MPCADPKCPICRPNWQEDEATAKKRAEEDKQDCINCWRFYQQKAEAIVSVGDPITRNRRINAAYAQLWLDDHRFQWAGLAAFASKQVGCGLLNAASMIGKSNRQRDAYQQWERQSSPLERLSPYASPRMPIPDQAMGAGGETVYQMLAQGNTAVFLDMWRLHMFYKEFGLKRLKRCLPERKQLRGSVIWPISKSVEFGEVKIEVSQGFEAIDSGNLTGGVLQLARHEQFNILQPAMYDDPAFAVLMRADQFAWALNIPTGSAQEIQLTFANQCTVTGGNARHEVFSKEPLANLADAEQRMAFVGRAAERFDQLLRHPLDRYSVENSLFLMAHPPRSSR